MINPFHDVNWQPDRDERRSFGRTLFVGGIIGALVFAAAAAYLDSTKLAVVRNVFAAIAILGIPIWGLPGRWSIPIYQIWFAVGGCIGIVAANLSLMLFYYLFFTPLALLLRLFGRDPLRRRPPQANSNWQKSAPPPERKRYTRQY